MTSILQPLFAICGVAAVAYSILDYRLNVRLRRRHERDGRTEELSRTAYMLQGIGLDRLLFLFSAQHRRFDDPTLTSLVAACRALFMVFAITFVMLAIGILSRLTN